MRLMFAAYACLVAALLMPFGGTASLIGQFVWIYAGLWLMASLALIMDLPGSRWVGLAAIVPSSLLILLPSARRIGFIWEHGGLDCAAGTREGSPAVFVLDWGFEIALLVPAVLLCNWLLRTRRRVAGSWKA